MEVAAAGNEQAVGGVQTYPVELAVLDALHGVDADANLLRDLCPDLGAIRGFARPDTAQQAARYVVPLDPRFPTTRGSFQHGAEPFFAV